MGSCGNITRDEIFKILIPKGVCVLGEGGGRSMDNQCTYSHDQNDDQKIYVDRGGGGRGGRWITNLHIAMIKMTTRKYMWTTENGIKVVLISPICLLLCKRNNLEDNHK